MRCVQLILHVEFADISKEIDELVDDWTPEPLVAPLTSFEEAENEKQPVIVGFVVEEPRHCAKETWLMAP